MHCDGFGKQERGRWHTGDALPSTTRGTSDYGNVKGDGDGDGNGDSDEEEEQGCHRTIGGAYGGGGEVEYVLAEELVKRAASKMSSAPPTLTPASCNVMDGYRTNACILWRACAILSIPPISKGSIALPASALAQYRLDASSLLQSRLEEQAGSNDRIRAEPTLRGESAAPCRMCAERENRRGMPLHDVMPPWQELPRRLYCP